MPPQHNQPPPPAGGPRPSFTPHPPHFDYSPTPHQQPFQPGQPQFQQNGSGNYEVVPPPATNTIRSSGHNPYEFIVNPNNPKRNKNPLGGSNSFLARIGLIVGGLVVIMIIVGIIISVTAPKGSTPGMTAIANRQQEIIRISTAAGQHVSGQDTQNFVANVQLSVTSSQQQILGYLANHGTKLKGKALLLDQNTQTDTLLANAATAGNYDSAVDQNLVDQLQTYKSLLQTTFKQTNNKEAQTLLQTTYSSADKLLKQGQALTASRP